MPNKFQVNNAGYRQLSNQEFVKLWQQSKTKNDFEQRLNSMIELDRILTSKSEVDFNQSVAEKRALIATHKGMLEQYDNLDDWWTQYRFEKNASDEVAMAIKVQRELRRDLGDGDFSKYLTRHLYSDYNSQVSRARRLNENGVGLKSLKRIRPAYTGPVTDYAGLKEYAQTFV
jgi:hypothetical protein